MTADDQKFEAKAKASLDASVYSLDKKTQDDLAFIRKKALEAQQTTSWVSFNAWVPAGALAFCAVLTALLLYAPKSIDDASRQMADQQNTANNQAEQVAMLEMLTNPEDLEAVTDPAFYVWMDEVLAAEDIENAV